MAAGMLRARVALVLDELQIAVNAGSSSGVEAGDVLYVLREVVIPDPEVPDGNLGTAFIRKGTMRIESVDEKFAIARVLTTSKSLLGPSEPDFIIVKGQQEGRGRVHLDAGDPVDILIDVEE